MQADGELKGDINDETGGQSPMTTTADNETLTVKQENFCRAYVETGNASEAYRRAYNAESMQADSIHVNASQLLKNDKVSARVAALQAELAARHRITADKIIVELGKIGFADAGDYFSWGPDGVTVKPSSELTAEQRAVVAEASQTVSATGGTIKVKLADKIQALDRLGRHLGLFTDRLEHTGKDGTPLDAGPPAPRDLARVILDILRTARVEDAEPDDDHANEPDYSAPRTPNADR